MNKTTLLLPVTLFLISCGGGSNDTDTPRPPPAPVPIDMEQTLDDFVANNDNIASVAMLTVKDGDIIFSHSAGFSDAARSQAPTRSTLYKTSSIAKLVIAVAVMQQVELGVLDIDQDIGNYLPFPVRNPTFPDKVITTRMLMQHSAGLANPAFGEATDRLFLAFDSSAIVQLHPLIEDALTPGSPDYLASIWLGGEPGTVHKNSNFGMVLLSYLVEELSGMHFIDYAKWNIFEPLGMDGTSHYFPDLAPAEVAALFDDDDNLTTQTSNWFYPRRAWQCVERDDPSVAATTAPLTRPRTAQAHQHGIQEIQRDAKPNLPNERRTDSAFRGRMRLRVQLATQGSTAA